MFSIKNYLISLVIFDIIIYGIICLFIKKRKEFTYISIRSPSLLIITNMSNFCVVLFLVLTKFTESYLISLFYYVFRFTMLFSIILRYERIFVCMRINLETFTNKRYLLREKFYIRILIGLSIILFGIIMLANKVKSHCFELGLFHASLNKNQIYVWIFWNFFEQAILVTYLYRIYITKLNYILVLESNLLLIIMFLFSNLATFISLKEKNDNDIFLYVSLIINYIYLILNGILPIFMSFCSEINIAYIFTPKLTNNLYLFLTNEECYESFNNYLIKRKDNSTLFLKLYTYIMKFKLDMILDIPKQEKLYEANDLYNNYFIANSQQIDQVILQKIKDKCQILKLNSCHKELFNDGLQYVYNELNKIFLEYKNSDDFEKIYKKITDSSFIQCKMLNAGLINKF